MPGEAHDGLPRCEVATATNKWPYIRVCQGPAAAIGIECGQLEEPIFLCHEHRVEAKRLGIPTVELP